MVFKFIDSAGAFVCPEKRIPLLYCTKQYFREPGRCFLAGSSLIPRSFIIKKNPSLPGFKLHVPSTNQILEHFMWNFNCITNASQYNECTASSWNDGFIRTPAADLCATTTVSADKTGSLQAKTCSRVTMWYTYCQSDISQVYCKWRVHLASIDVKSPSSSKDCDSQPFVYSRRYGGLYKSYGINFIRPCSPFIIHKGCGL